MAVILPKTLLMWCTNFGGAYPKSSKNLASLNVERGVVTAAGTDAAANATYILKPSNDGSSWSVSGTCLKMGFCHD
jgi:hypothetical protein